MGTWRRQSSWSTSIQTGYVWLDAIPAGGVYLRNRFRWGFYGDSPITVDMQAYARALVSFGLVTTIGNGTEIPPSPVTTPNDVAPPTQRWIYWETRAPVVSAIDQAAGVIAWKDSGSTAETDTKGQVLATGLPSGDTLNLWASWDSAFNWSGSNGNVTLWYGISTYRNL
jgi:hypothetical protein